MHIPLSGYISSVKDTAQAASRTSPRILYTLTVGLYFLFSAKLLYLVMYVFTLFVHQLSIPLSCSRHFHVLNGSH